MQARLQGQNWVKVHSRKRYRRELTKGDLQTMGGKCEGHLCSESVSLFLMVRQEEAV
jgi:hypothetical protein